MPLFSLVFIPFELLEASILKSEVRLKDSLLHSFSLTLTQHSVPGSNEARAAGRPRAQLTRTGR